EHAEEAKRLLRESREEEHGEEIEQTVHVLAETITAAELVLSRLRNLDLAHGEALLGREHRQEPVLVAVDRDLLRDAPPHDANVAAEVVEGLPRDRAQQAVKSAPAKRLETGAAPRPAVRDDEIRVRGGVDQLRKVARVDLEIRGQRHQLRAVRVRESDHQRGRFPEAPAELDDLDRLTAGTKLREPTPVLALAVEHVDHLIRHTAAIEAATIIVMERLDVVDALAD